MNKNTIKSILIFTFSVLLLSTTAFAAPFGRIVEIKGEGFISHEGKTKDIRVGDVIEMNSEIALENAAQVTFTDNADHRFHVGNSASVAVFQKHIELRSGDLWFQSLNRTDDYKITTANAAVNYLGGEAILSYDSVKGKTQLMVISSVMKLSNLRASDLNLTVAEGNFSFIDNAYDEGAPRDPTPVGEKTYRQLIAQFKNVAPLEKNAVAAFKHNDTATAGRGIASVPAIDHTVEKELEVYKKTLIEKTVAEVPATEKKIKKAKTADSTVVASTPLEVKIYGLKSAPVEMTVKSRAPASVLDEPVPALENHNANTNTNEHYKESDKLIEHLNKL